MRWLIKRRFDTLYQEQGASALEPNNPMLAMGAPGSNDIIIGERDYDTNLDLYSHTTLRKRDVPTGATRTFFSDQSAPPEKIAFWMIDVRSLLKHKPPDEKKPRHFCWGFSLITSLTITYFHTGCSTIIGVISFHGPVRDGKGWYRFTMVIRHNLYKQLSPMGRQRLESGRSIKLLYYFG